MVEVAVVILVVIGSHLLEVAVATNVVGRREIVRKPRIWNSGDCEKNGFRPLPIEFDKLNQDKTWRPIGDNGDMFISLAGTLVMEILYRYTSWEAVSTSNKTLILPTIEKLFDMRPHYEGE